MTLTELRYILAVAKSSHFGRAANECHVSQPTLSVAISKLESELGVAIFERNRNEVRITEVGKQILAQAQKVMNEATVIMEIAQAAACQLTTPLKVGAIFTIAPYLFPHLIPQLKKLIPQMPLYIYEDFTENLSTKLLQGDLDVIFISLPYNKPGIVTHFLYEESFSVVMPIDHPLSKKKSIDVKELINEKILILSEKHCFRHQVVDACSICFPDNDQKNVIEGASLETLRHMVASGMGITILPESAAQAEQYKSVLCARSFKGIVPSRQIALAWRVSFPRPKAITALLQVLQTISI